MDKYMKALLDIYEQAPAAGEDVSYLIARSALAHTHVRGRDGVQAKGDECLVCGLDLRDGIHATVQTGRKE